MEIVSVLVGAAAGLIIGSGIIYILLKKSTERKAASILKEAEKEGEMLKERKLIKAKEKFLQLKEEHEKVISERNNKMQQSENRAKQKEKTLNQKLQDVNKKERDINAKRGNLDKQL